MSDPTLVYPINNEPGMTLRDWYAGQVLVGLMQNEREDNPHPRRWHAQRAFLIADAMMVEREKVRA